MIDFILGHAQVATALRSQDHKTCDLDYARQQALLAANGKSFANHQTTSNHFQIMPICSQFGIRFTRHAGTAKCVCLAGVPNPVGVPLMYWMFDSEKPLLKASPLKEGDTIAIVSTSSGFSAQVPHRVHAGVAALKNLGFKVHLTESVVTCDSRGKAGTAKARAHDIVESFRDSNIKGIISAFGGLFSNELLDHLNFAAIQANPKIFCGYSDSTILCHAFLKQCSLVTFYGPCLITQFAEFPEPLPYTVEYFLKATSLSMPIGNIPAACQWTDEVLDWRKQEDLRRPRKLWSDGDYDWIRSGRAVGRLLAGCLPTILQLKETCFWLDFEGCVLVLDIPPGCDFAKGLSLAYVESNLIDLKNAGVLSKIEGLIVGRGFGYTDDERRILREIIYEHTGEFEFPVLANVNVGHCDPIATIPLGVRCEINSDKNLFTILESGVGASENVE